MRASSARSKFEARILLSLVATLPHHSRERRRKEYLKSKWLGPGLCRSIFGLRHHFAIGAGVGSGGLTTGEAGSEGSLIFFRHGFRRGFRFGLLVQEAP